MSIQKRRCEQEFHEKILWCAYSVPQINISAQSGSFSQRFFNTRRKNSSKQKKKKQQSIGVYVFYTGKSYGLYYTLFFRHNHVLKNIDCDSSRLLLTVLVVYKSLIIRPKIQTFSKTPEKRRK